MKVSEIQRILDAEVLCGDEFVAITEVDSAFGADMMSDVLAFVTPTTLILTGMVNMHVIRTAEMLDLRCIVFVRGKKVADEILDAARALDMIVLSTDKTLFTSSGLLYMAGLRGCTRE